MTINFSVNAVGTVFVDGRLEGDFLRKQNELQFKANKSKTGNNPTAAQKAAFKAEQNAFRADFAAQRAAFLEANAPAVVTAEAEATATRKALLEDFREQAGRHLDAQQARRDFDNL